MIKTSIKIIVAVVLIGLLGTIAYIKTTVSAKRSDLDLEQIKSDYFHHQDSLFAAQLDDSTRYYLDSLRRLDQNYLTEIDSLNDYYANIENDLVGQNEKLIEENKVLQYNLNKANSSARKTAVAKEPARSNVSRKVKDDYQSLIGQLPSDLTDYEKKVAYNEVIVDLSGKYKLSPATVKKYIK